MDNTLFKDAVALRHHLHMHPEVFGQERETSALLASKLKECNPDELITFSNYGLVAVFNGKEPGKNILIRADFDALPIQEVNDFEHRSKFEGVSHKCGHDGHAAILYALARTLSQSRPEKGSAILLFQPAEENGAGAVGMLNDPAFARLSPDMAIAFHNLPGYPLHTLVVKDGSFTAAANSIIIKLYGKTSHAAEPEMGINPAGAMAEITKKLLGLCKPDLDADDFRLVTPIYSELGEKSYGVSAGYGELHFTLRAWHNEARAQLEQECEAEARRVAADFGLKSSIEWTQSFFSNQNNSEVMAAVRRVGRNQGLDLTERTTPFKWGEDFGIFTKKLPGAMFGLGSGEGCPALHNPDYDFPDALIPTGMAIFHALISELQ